MNQRSRSTKVQNIKKKSVANFKVLWNVSSKFVHNLEVKRKGHSKWWKVQCVMVNLEFICSYIHFSTISILFFQLLLEMQFLSKHWALLKALPYILMHLKEKKTYLTRAEEAKMRETSYLAVDWGYSVVLPHQQGLSRFIFHIWYRILRTLLVSHHHEKPQTFEVEQLLQNCIELNKKCYTRRHVLGRQVSWSAKVNKFRFSANFQAFEKSCKFEISE